MTFELGLAIATFIWVLAGFNELSKKVDSLETSISRLRQDLSRQSQASQNRKRETSFSERDGE